MHKVSATASNKFWDLSLQYAPKLQTMWEREGQVKGVPGFINQKRKLYKQYCPKVEMEFAFMSKIDGKIEKVNGGTAPVKKYQNNPDYIKLYEIASVKVIIIYIYTKFAKKKGNFFYSMCTYP